MDCEAKDIGICEERIIVIVIIEGGNRSRESRRPLVLAVEIKVAFSGGNRVREIFYEHIVSEPGKTIKITLFEGMLHRVNWWTEKTGVSVGDKVCMKIIANNCAGVRGWGGGR